MWKQCIMELHPLTQYGWKIENNEVTVEWDSEAIIQTVKDCCSGGENAQQGAQLHSVAAEKATEVVQRVANVKPLPTQQES